MLGDYLRIAASINWRNGVFTISSSEIAIDFYVKAESPLIEVEQG
jgi:hypothetical protein